MIPLFQFVLRTNLGISTFIRAMPICYILQKDMIVLREKINKLIRK